MNIWKPLPGDTNTVYVERVPDPLAGSSIRWTPEAGLRVRVFFFRYRLTCSATVASRTPYFRVLSGSDVLYEAASTSIWTAGQVRWHCVTGTHYAATTTYGLTNFFGWNLGTYLVHGVTLEGWFNNMQADDQIDQGVVYYDSWYDLCVDVGGER